MRRKRNCLIPKEMRDLFNAATLINFASHMILNVKMKILIYSSNGIEANKLLKKNMLLRAKYSFDLFCSINIEIYSR